MIFSRLISADWTARGTVSISCSTPSMRNRTRRSVSVGSMCRSDARFWIACSISEFTYRTIGASSPTELNASIALVSSSPRVAATSSRSFSARWKRSSAFISSSRATTTGRTSMPVGGAHVVEGEHVAGIDDGDHERDRRRTRCRARGGGGPASSGSWPRRRHRSGSSTRSTAAAVGLGQRLGQLDLGDGALVEQDVAQVPPGLARLVGGVRRGRPGRARGRAGSSSTGS